MAFSILLLPPLNFGSLAVGVLLFCNIFVSDMVVASVDRDANVLACLFDGFLTDCSLLLFVVLDL